jgi:hypothetical protein
VANHRHLHYAAHDHGICHHWVSGFEFHKRYFTIIQGVSVTFESKEVAKSACEGNQSGELGKQDRAVS